MTQMMGQVSQSLQQQQMQVGQRMDSTSQLVASVQNQLGKLQQSTGQILEVGKDISSLQNILKAPKLRGSMGELFLGDLLSQILPGDSFELQYMFKNGSRVDAVVKLLHGLVSIDSKFPLEGFIRLQDAKEEEKASLQKQFARDVKKHIDDIASKYILPGEGTFDFALMYIPAENVYYETIIRYEKDDPGLWAYALTKRVIPVPANFQVLIGSTCFRGLVRVFFHSPSSSLSQVLFPSLPSLHWRQERLFVHNPSHLIS
jgi:DNA recombination protein RmuC